MTRLLLTGYAVGSILAALLTMAMYVSGANLRAIFSFLLGGLAAASWERLLIAPRSSSRRACSSGFGRARSTGCCSVIRRRATSAWTSSASAGSSWSSPR